ncbi:MULTISPECIES: amino acid ABC transporter permease [Agrobacterium]|uniref:Amino acid ABC transporter permease n=1 Tax=Agrobacterium tumefaciens TaxID=358 RepID=A0AAE6BBQ2_AGRTU|nr:MULTISPECIES: amino acid ABC transporter permease [Agrobacterium]QCL74353.1 amino acid ABC transporter permease [Agrobacterium tumefaciens]QCL79930.1 amino acid ABC transporter permease [Agrobacterium tumefaciens]CUX28664.1 putative amino acid ABC transporter permease protein [Agrobacterium sp. NCPPB 925]
MTVLDTFSSNASPSYRLSRRFRPTRLLAAAVTAVCVGLFVIFGWWLLKWGVLDATFDPQARQAECMAASGACWSVIANRWRLIFFGLYPHEQHWRSAAACMIMMATIVASCMPALWTAERLAATWLSGFIGFYVLMAGGVFGLPQIREEQWGGLSLTLFTFAASVIAGMPLAILLALLRNSSMPWIAKLTGLMIDTVRALPLLSILFTFAIILPFVLPDFAKGEKLYRVILGLTLYFAVYQAEIIRGGMQAVPKGQDEAARALGLPYSKRMTVIILPQAFKFALPATINQFVVTFMETSLVTVVGFFDLLASANAAYRTGEWTFAFAEVYVFIGAIYFAVVFSLSRYGAFLERRMNKDIR